MTGHFRLRGDLVVKFLQRFGATSTDASGTFPGDGRHRDNIAAYISAIENGWWNETDRPIKLNAKTGAVWQGSDRTVALSLVDWSKVDHVPLFVVQVDHL